MGYIQQVYAVLGCMEVKGELYATGVRSVRLYGSER